MKKAEFVKRYGEVAYRRMLGQARQWGKANPERHKQRCRQWREANPEKVEELSHNLDRKGGKYYEKKLRYDRFGLRGERNKIRRNHAKQWHDFKMIIAPDSQLHHSWYPQSAEYEGLALVETNQHRHGIIDVIEILEGEIKVFTEKEIANRGEL